MDKNTILDNLNDLPVSANISVPFSSTVSAPISAPSLIENQANVNSLLSQLLSNKLYIYIIIGVIILAIISYYLYKKYFSKKVQDEKTQDEKTQDEKTQDEKTQDEKTQEQLKENIFVKKEIDSKKHILSSNIEYYLLDRAGKPIYMNQYFTNFLNGPNDQTVLINNTLNKQQRPKLIHPNEETNIEKNILDNEDNNITTQDLTLEEIEELKQQLDLMQKKQTASITAENDEDNEEGTF
jgi:Ca2+/Na+ antiporter